MNMKKIIVSFIVLQSLSVAAVSLLDFRTKSSSPLLYNMMDLDGRDWFASAAIIGSRSFDHESLASNMTITGKHYFKLDETGSGTTALVANGDMNPIWFGLTSTNGSGTGGDYQSTVELEPVVRLCGALLHFYKKCDKYFLDIRSAVLRCRAQVKITETGGGNGDAANTAGVTIKDFAGAMSNSDWNYGKMGDLQKKVGLDNIQIKIGAFVGDSEGDFSDRKLGLYLLGEIPTGKGTKSEYAFEPRVGKNHFGLGLGFDEYYIDDNNQVVLGANWRYLFGAQEKRSFDLKDKPWTRYIQLVSMPTDSTTKGTLQKGINLMTLDATVTLGHQLNGYLRWTKRWDNVQVELGYNLFYRQAEKISDVADFANDFGIENLYSGNGSTMNQADMNTFIGDAINAVREDPGVAISKTDLDLSSGAVGVQVTSSVAARVEYIKDRIRFGLGGSVEASHVTTSFPMWNTWINFGTMF